MRVAMLGSEGISRAALNVRPSRPAASQGWLAQEAVECGGRAEDGGA